VLLQLRQLALNLLLAVRVLLHVLGEGLLLGLVPAQEVKAAAAAAAAAASGHQQQASKCLVRPLSWPCTWGQSKPVKHGQTQ
jgi:hypothetical protein